MAATYALEDALIKIRSHIPYEVFNTIDVLLRKRWRNTMHILKQVPDKDHAALYEHDNKFTKDLVWCVLNKYKEFTPPKGVHNAVELVIGKEYEVTFHVTPDWYYTAFHPLVQKRKMTYAGRDLMYPEESHVFISNTSDYTYYDKMQTKEDRDAIVFLTNVCASYVEHEQKRVKVHVCPNKFVATPVDVTHVEE